MMRVTGLALAGTGSLTLIRADGRTIVLAPGESAHIELDPRGKFETIRRLHGIRHSIQGRL